MNPLIKPWFLFLFGLSWSQTNAQKNFTVQLQFPAHLNAKYLHLYYENGKKQIRVVPVIKDNQMTLSGDFYAKYATILVAYRDGKNQFQDFSNFWITDKPATIKFIVKDSTLTNLLENRTLTNAYEVRDMGEQKLKNYIAIEQQAFLDFYRASEEKLANNDSLTWRLLNQKTDSVQLKTLEFIKQNGNLYFSFWYFRKGIVSNTITATDTLIKIYNTAFPENFKNSEEGTEIERKLKARSIKKNDQAPDFSTTDVNSKALTLHGYQGKYVLLTFWASWCGPCVEEIPLLARIRKTYTQEKLEIISINHDNNSTAFVKAVKKYNMNWTHILSNNLINDDYGIAGIPEVFLIDPTGKILYIRREEQDYKLNLLTKLLTEKMAK